MKELQEKNLLTRIDFEAKKLTLRNGKVFKIEPELSIQRWSRLQDLQIEAGFGVTFEDMLKNLRQIYDAANAQRMADAAVIAYNTMNGIKKIADREPVILKMCAIFMNEAEEDRKEITDSMISKKIEAWTEDGVSMDDFFALALNTLKGFIEAYKNDTLTSLKG